MDNVNHFNWHKYYRQYSASEYKSLNVSLLLLCLVGRSQVLAEEVSRRSSTLTYQWKKPEAIAVYCEVTHSDGSSIKKAVSNQAKISIEICKFFY